MSKLTLLIVVLTVFSISACGKKEKAQTSAEIPGQAAATPAAGLAAAAEDYIPDTGTYGTVTQCPVMGEKIVVGKDTKAVKYKGKTYFLCCPSCVGQFKANPEKYAK